MPRLNPAQHRLWMRHIERSIETLREGDRLLRGVLSDVVERMVKAIQAESARVDQEGSTAVRFAIAALPLRLVPYVEDPFVAALSFNLYCQRTGMSHTQAQKSWEGGAAAAAARNLVFLPPIYHDLWNEGALDKTRLVAIANRNLTTKAYLEVATLIRTRRKEDLDGLLLKMPPGSVQLGRRGPGEAMEAAERNGWMARLATLEIPGELVMEAGAQVTDPAPALASDATTPAPPASEGENEPAVAARRPDEAPFEAASRALRAGLSGARLAPEVVEALAHSPDPGILVERFLSGHRRSGTTNLPELTKTLFFAHAGVMQRLVADDKLLLRHFRPVKTQKRGQLFYRLLEIIEEAITEVTPEGAPGPGLGEAEAMRAVRRVIIDLNKDPNRYLVVPDEWLGEVTRRHLYFGSRTRKEGAAYKWYRKIGSTFYLGAHKTEDELLERAARRAQKGVAASALDLEDELSEDDAT
ncbi:MAG: hypothetical protein AABX89_01100 [Candidatus Thermoplasmatota archaeon]